jgi:hypothetical protein
MRRRRVSDDAVHVEQDGIEMRAFQFFAGHNGTYVTDLARPRNNPSRATLALGSL